MITHIFCCPSCLLTNWQSWASVRARMMHLWSSAPAKECKGASASPMQFHVGAGKADIYPGSRASSGAGWDCSCLYSVTPRFTLCPNCPHGALARGAFSPHWLLTARNIATCRSCLVTTGGSVRPLCTSAATISEPSPLQCCAGTTPGANTAGEHTTKGNKSGYSEIEST